MEILRLKAHPKLGRCLQQAPKPQCGIRGDTAFAEDNFAQAVERDPEPAGSVDLFHTQRLEGRSRPAGIEGPNQFGSLVIVFDADFVPISFFPVERDPVLTIDPDAVPARPIASQLLESVAGSSGRQRWMFMLDNLWRALPRPLFTDEETEAIADRLYDYVWERSASGDDGGVGERKAQFFGYKNL